MSALVKAGHEVSVLHRKPKHALGKKVGNIMADRNDPASLKAALKVATPQKQYTGDAACAAAGRDGDQKCFDAIRMRPLGAVTQPLIDWINRPTFQQAVEVQGHR